MHADILTEFGYGGDELMSSLDQVYSARWRFRNDSFMTEFFNGLIHVQMDFTGDGPIQPGDTLTSVPLHELCGNEISLCTILEKSQKANRPLVVFAGSWT